MTAPGAAEDVPLEPGVSFGFNLAKIPDHGEDSDPVLRDGPDLGLAGVFDGMGGAGGTVYDTADGARSGAYLASRVVREVVEAHLLANLAPDRALPGAGTAAALHDAIEAALRSALADLDAPASRLRSKLLRALPTTMAHGALQRAEPGSDRWTCQVLWAGDSRVYAFTPDGARQLSTDDLRDPGDAMSNLRHDSVISNALSADTEFSINHRRVVLDAPFLLVAATDGCFGYLRSPMHFEALVLRCLVSARSEEDWSAALQREVAAVTGDHASMAVVAVGGDLSALQRRFAPRSRHLDEEYLAPMDRLVAEEQAAEDALEQLRLRRADDAAERWQRYRRDYEQVLQHTDEPDPEVAPGEPQRRIWNEPKRIATGAPRPQDEDHDEEGPR